MEQNVTKMKLWRKMEWNAGGIGRNVWKMKRNDRKTEQSVCNINAWRLKEWKMEWRYTLERVENEISLADQKPPLKSFLQPLHYNISPFLFQYRRLTNQKTCLQSAFTYWQHQRIQPAKISLNFQLLQVTRYTLIARKILFTLLCACKVLVKR